MKNPWCESDLDCPLCDGKVLFRFTHEPHTDPDNLETMCSNEDQIDHPRIPRAWDDVHIRLMFLHGK